ncbi:MAG: hypothetical protein WB919_16100, partial [Candidatus Sulfotelmatobacter sp.]
PDAQSSVGKEASSFNPYASQSTASTVERLASCGKFLTGNSSRPSISSMEADSKHSSVKTFIPL